MKTAIMIGRFQPITKAHYNIIKNAIQEYQETFVVIVNSKISIAANSRRRSRAVGKDLPKSGDREKWLELKKSGKLSKSANPKKLENEIIKNPFSGALRAKMIYDSFSGKLHTSHIIQSPSANIESIVNKIMEQTSNKNFVILCGQDRKDIYKMQIDSAIKKEFIPKGVNVEIKVISRDMDAADNISATKVRQAIKNKDKQTFLSLVPKGIESYFDRMRKFLMTESQRSFFRKMLLEMTHIEDLKVGDFISFIKDIYKSEASVKLDGTANLAFGLADDGRLYTAFGRTAFHKGGTTPEEKRAYSVDEWLAKNKLYFNSAASSHAALEQILPEIKSVLKPGQEVSSEIMFGDKPNCIKYDFGGVNYLVILNNDELADKINKKVIHITTKNYIIGGDELQIKNVKQTWSFGKTQIIDTKKYDINIVQELKELESFLEDETDGFRNLDILSMRASGKSKEMVLKVRKKAQKLKLNVKEQLLKQFVRQVKQGEYIPSQGYSHEGIVLKSKDGKMTKIIDKDVFTAIVIKLFKKQGISKEEVITYLTDRIDNFDKYYSDISDDMKDRMRDALKMMKIEMIKEKK